MEVRSWRGKPGFRGTGHACCNLVDEFSIGAREGVVAQVIGKHDRGVFSCKPCREVTKARAAGMATRVNAGRLRGSDTVRVWAHVGHTGLIPMRKQPGSLCVYEICHGWIPECTDASAVERHAGL